MQSSDEPFFDQSLGRLWQVSCLFDGSQDTHVEYAGAFLDTLGQGAQDGSDSTLLVQPLVFVG
jgi:hypothetical protein